MGFVTLGLLKAEVKKYLVSVGLISAAGVATSGTVDNGPCAGRLTASSTLPVTTADTTSATLYFLPHNGNKIPLYDGSTWVLHTLGSSGISLDASALTHSQVYDIFVYDSGGTLTLDATAWSDHGAGTGARVTALATQDGVLVKTGALTRRYIGTVRTVNDTGSKVRDALGFRLIWNAQNRVAVRDWDDETTDSWTVSATNGTWGGVNSTTALPWRHQFVVGLDTPVLARAQFRGKNSADRIPGLSVALNGTAPSRTSSTMAAVDQNTASLEAVLIAEFNGLAPAGYGYLQGVETTNNSAGTTPTAYGDNGGTVGSGVVPVQAGMTYMGER